MGDDEVSKEVKSNVEEIADCTVKDSSVVLNDCRKEMEKEDEEQDEDVREILR